MSSKYSIIIYRRPSEKGRTFALFPLARGEERRDKGSKGSESFWGVFVLREAEDEEERGRAQESLKAVIFVVFFLFFFGLLLRYFRFGLVLGGAFLGVWVVGGLLEVGY